MPHNRVLGLLLAAACSLVVACEEKKPVRTPEAQLRMTLAGNYWTEIEAFKKIAKDAEETQDAFLNRVLGNPNVSDEERGCLLVVSENATRQYFRAAELCREARPNPELPPEVQRQLLKAGNLQARAFILRAKATKEFAAKLKAGEREPEINVEAETEAMQLEAEATILLADSN